MFERIVIRKSLNGPTITAGELAEALLFYQNVHILLDNASLVSLIKSIGMRTLLRILNLPEVNTTYFEEYTATQTEQSAHGPEYSLIAFRITGDQEIGNLTSRRKRLEYILMRQGHTKKEAKILCDRFRQCVTYKKLSDDYFVKGGLISSANVDLLNHDYVASAARIAAQELIGSHQLPDGFHFEINSTGPKFRVVTNLNFDLVNKVQSIRNPELSSFNPAHITSKLLDASIGLIFAGHYGGDFYTSEAESRIISSRQQYLLQKFHRDRADLCSFQQIALKGSPGIVDAINAGERNFDEFLELLASARRFKKWLKGKSPDEPLVSGYLQDITANTWLSQLKGKWLRVVVGTIVGTVSPLAGLAASIGDAFFLDKLAIGWRPNHFITDKLKPFVDPNDSDGE